MKTVKAFYTVAVLILVCSFGSVEVRNLRDTIVLILASGAMLGTLAVIHLIKENENLTDEE